MMSFDVVEWTDFASDDWQKAMRKHLGAGSKRCLETLASWQKAANAAAVDASYQPPAERVRMGKEALATAGLVATPPETGGLIELLLRQLFPRGPGWHTLGCHEHPTDALSG